MPTPRKVFRIEQMAATQLEEGFETDAAVPHHELGLRHAEIMRELAAIRAALTAVSGGSSPPNGARGGNEVQRLASELSLIADAIGGESAAGEARDGGARVAEGGAGAPFSLARIETELAAVVTGTEQATQKILAAAEEIDAAVSSLIAGLEGRIEQDLAQDIQDHVIRIFEACNFQDLIGQRLAKVMTTLKFVEEHIGRALDEIREPVAGARRGGQALHGPRLEGERGHASQREIDALFVERRAAPGE